MIGCIDLKVYQRGNYSTRTIGRLALLMFIIGYGDIMCFPYYFLKYGIEYLVPYLTIFFLIGFPLLSLEMLVGQFQNLGPILGLSNLAPILKGIGWGMAFSCLICCSYFNLYVSACLVLFWRSLLLHLGVIKEDIAAPLISFMNPENPFMAVKSNDLYIGYLVSWIIVVLCILREFHRSNKVIVICNAIPYFLLVLGIFLKNFHEYSYLESGYPAKVPDESLWDTLKNGRPLMLEMDFWIIAFKHVVFDLGLGFGVITTLASYNRTNANCILDALLIPLLGLSFGFGCLYLVYDHYEKSKEQPSLLLVLCSYRFIVPKAVAGIIYLMSFIKGLGSEMTKMQTLFTSIFDEFPDLREKYHGRVVCFVGFVMMLPGISLCLIPGINKIIVETSLNLLLIMALALACAGPFVSLQYYSMKEKLVLKTWIWVDWYLLSCWCFFTPLVLICGVVAMAVLSKFDLPSLVVIILLLLVMSAISASQITSMTLKEMLKPTKDFCLERERERNLLARPTPHYFHTFFQSLEIYKCIFELDLNTARTNSQMTKF